MKTSGAFMVGLMAGLVLAAVIIAVQPDPLPSPQESPKTLTAEHLLDAMEWIESKGDPNAVCPNGCCVGAYQLTKIYVDDVNRILAKSSYYDGPNKIESFTYKDRWNKGRSRLVANIVMVHYAYRDWENKRWDMMGYLETAARTHKSPSRRNHDSTKPYWEKVKARMEANWE